MLHLYQKKIVVIMRTREIECGANDRNVQCKPAVKFCFINLFLKHGTKCGIWELFASSIRSWFFCGKANVGHLEKSEKSQGIVLSNEVAGSSANFNSNSSKFYKINHSKCYMGHLRDTSLVCLFCEKFFYIVVVQKANSWYSFKSKI